MSSKLEQLRDNIKMIADHKKTPPATALALEMALMQSYLMDEATEANDKPKESV